MAQVNERRDERQMNFRRRIIRRDKTANRDQIENAIGSEVRSIHFHNGDTEEKNKSFRNPVREW